MLRLSLILGAFAIGAASLISIQAGRRAIGLPPQPQVTRFFYRVLRRLLRLKVHLIGTPVVDRPVLFVANHASWIDIAAIGSTLPVHFVAKREVRAWPLIGLTAALTGTVFVDRNRRQQTPAVTRQIAQRLADGRPVVLFAEGTSNDGNRVLPFRSALVGAVSEAMSVLQGTVVLQPVSISYTHINGLPMGRQHRPLVAWYGDTDFLPHLRAYAKQASVDVLIAFGDPILLGADGRKAATKSVETTVRTLTSRALRG
jgi:1-acyl-sn-glycerol-3-phosphate acyltransferase